MQQKKGSAKSFWTTILWVGFLVGLADITSACINFYINTGKNPEIVFKYVASAVFGKNAYTENGMIFFGALFHFMVAYSFTIFFFFIYPRINFLSRNRLLTGILYGAFIWTIMNLVVVPITRAKAGSPSWKKTPIDMGILIIAIGIPLSFLAYWYYREKLRDQGKLRAASF